MADTGTQLPNDKARLAMEIFHQNLSLQFGRLNFFLVSTAFLIAALTTVTIVGGNVAQASLRVDLLAYAIVAIGYYLALFFALTNLLNANLLARMQKELMQQHGFVTQSPYAGVKNIVESEWKIGNITRSLLRFLRDPITYGKDSPSAHTWLIPALFVVFWLVTWLFVLPLCWATWAFSLGLPCFSLLFLWWRTSKVASWTYGEGVWKQTVEVRYRKLTLDGDLRIDDNEVLTWGPTFSSREIPFSIAGKRANLKFTVGHFQKVVLELDVEGKQLDAL